MRYASLYDTFVAAMPVYRYVTHYMRKCDDEDPTASSQNFELLSLVLTTSEAFLF